MSSQTPRVESFVLRFVADAAESATSAPARGWHGVVVHVQSDQERHFTNLADAIAFIARYVPVGDVVFPAEEGGRKTEAEQASSSIPGGQETGE